VATHKQAKKSGQGESQACNWQKKKADGTTVKMIVIKFYFL
jgi:hypothetical protein